MEINYSISLFYCLFINSILTKICEKTIDFHSKLNETTDALIQELKDNPIDVNSFSRPDITRVSHIQWAASVNFDEQFISGLVDLTVDKLIDCTNQLILDTSALTIIKIKDKESDEALIYELSPTVEVFGSKLTINLLDKKRSIVRISYRTGVNATGLQWLKPEQTAGKRHPYLFSQCQSVHCRSLLPCQDTPAVKATYNATIIVPKVFEALMSAVLQGSGTLLKDGLRKMYRFKQVIPIPSYLIAIVVADLVSKKVGPRSRVWTEAEMIDRCAYEFAETEQMVATAEEIVGPYVWGVYDLLILPPSFPLGGMENPCLTFVTPTLLAGDRSLTDVVVHEIAHSWTGNLVTNKNWGHFWLNEGFTRFLEMKVIGRLSGGEPKRQFQAIEGLKELKSDIQSLGADNPYTKLVTDMRGVDPSDTMNAVPYEKGHTFLFYLEQLLGGPQVFEPFLKAYIEKFKYKSIDTNDFKSFFTNYFKRKISLLKSIDWNVWLNSTGMPPIIPDYDQTLSKECTALAKRWITASDNKLSQFSAKDISSMDAWQRIEFLNQLLESELPISITKIKAITDAYDLRSVQNAEIRAHWIRLCLKARWKGCVDDAIKFITSQGRMKYLKPIYKALYAWDETRKQAINTFKANSNKMMYLSASQVAKELKLKI